MMRNPITNRRNSAARLFSGSRPLAHQEIVRVTPIPYGSQSGSPPENADRLFGAFFATKSSGANDQT
jgi:hypothetical protein